MTKTKTTQNKVATGIFEVHEHANVRGGARVKHSHEGGNWGDRPHEHPGYGPGTYTIDRDEWYRDTGLKGGGRKVFTGRPSGPALHYEESKPLSYTLVVHRTAI